jgi:hypothetical protein
MPEEEIPWMIDVGYQLTVYARGAYPLDQQVGDINHLLGSNELQHQNPLTGSCALTAA